MTRAQLNALKRDSLEWTGRLEPETDEQVDVYFAASMPFDVDKFDALQALRAWCRCCGSRPKSSNLVGPPFSTPFAFLGERAQGPPLERYGDS